MRDALGKIEYGARVASYSPSQFHAEGFITHDTAYSSPLSARNLIHDETAWKKLYVKGDLGRLLLP